MIKSAIIIHGAYGNPNENWIPWLKKNLELLKIKTIVPCFPTPDGQSLNNWMDVLKQYDAFLTEESILIGHSVGASFILSILEKKKIFASYLVSGFIGKLGIAEFDKINRTFTEKKFDFKKIKKNCKKIVIFHGDNDPYVPLEKAKELLILTNGKLIIIPKGGHLNEKTGFTKFESLLIRIKEDLPLARN